MMNLNKGNMLYDRVTPKKSDFINGNPLDEDNPSNRYSPFDTATLSVSYCCVSELVANTPQQVLHARLYG